MRPAPRLAFLACCLLTWTLAAGALPADETVRIDHHLAPLRPEALVAAAGGGPGVVVTAEGGLRFADGTALAVGPTGPFAFVRNQATVQTGLGGGVPVVMTTRDGDRLAMETTAFVAASPPTACLRVVLRNKTGEAAAPVLRFEMDQAQAGLPGGLLGFRRGGQVAAVLEAADGRGEAIAAEEPKRSVFRREGGRPLPGWAKPNRPCDAAFRNIVAGFSEPATYHLQAEKGKRYVVAVGLCESHWRETGQRIVDLLIEGRKVATVDPVAKPHGPHVPFVLTFPATDADGDGWITVTSVANPKSPDQNSIVNVLWLFEADAAAALAPDDIASGKASRLAACYVDCGGQVEAPGPAVLDYRVPLEPNGSATLWLKLPLGAVKVAQVQAVASLEPADLLVAAEKGWRDALGRASAVAVSDAAPTDLLYASVANLLMLRQGSGPRTPLAAGPFRPSGSPEAAALGAVALDRMGLHAEAAAVLEDLVARQAGDHLWHGDDPWVATGQALWALATHYELTCDKTWLAAHFTPMRRAAEALLAACDLTTWSTHALLWLEHGILPPSPYRGQPADYWLGRDFWAMTGIRSVTRAARALERPNDFLWMEDRLEAYVRAVRATLAESRVTGPAAECLPAAAGETARWAFAPAVAAVVPLRTEAASAKLVSATFSYVDSRSTEGLPGGLDGGSPLVDLPLACRFGMARAALDQVEPAVRVLAGVANCASAAGALAEQVDVAQRRAGGPMPSAAAAAAYVLLVRDMLVREDGDTLHLLPCVPREWLARGLTVRNLPTTFGPLSLTAKLDADGRRLVVEPTLQARRPVKAVVLHAPLPRGETASKTFDGWPGAERLELKFGG